MSLWLCRFLACQYKLSIRWWRIISSKVFPNQYTCETINCWRLGDAHFQNGSVTVSLSLLPINAADTLVMNNSQQIASQLSYLQDQTLLTLHWRSSLKFCCYCVAHSFAYQGCQSVDYGQPRANCFPIKLLPSAKIVHAPLTLIFRMGLLPGFFHILLAMLTIHWLCITSSKVFPKWLAYKTKYHWHSIDSHVQHGAVMVSQLLFHFTAANTFVTYNRSNSLPN